MSSLGQLEISLFSESGANLLSLWSVLFVHSSLIACLALLPLGAFFGFLRWLPKHELEPILDLVYIHTESALFHTAFFAVVSLTVRHLVGSENARRIALWFYVPLYVGIVTLSFPLGLPIRLCRWVQRFLMVCYLFVLVYVSKKARAAWARSQKQRQEQDQNANQDQNQNQNELEPESVMIHPLLIDGTLRAVGQGVAFSIVAVILSHMLNSRYIEGSFLFQLVIRLFVVTGIFFVADFYQLVSLIRLPPLHMTRRMEVVSLVNAHMRYTGRMLLCLCQRDTMDHHFFWMCLAVACLDFLNRATYNIRFHVLSHWWTLWQQRPSSWRLLSCKSRFRLPFWSKDAYNENRDPGGGMEGSQANPSQSQSSSHMQSPETTMASSTASRMKKIQQTIVVVSSAGVNQSSGVLGGQNVGGVINRDEYGNLVYETEQNIPYALPSPLRQMRMKQILDNVASEIRVSIAVSVMLYLIHPVFPASVVYTPANFSDCVYLVGVQVLFEFVSDLLSFYVEIYVYRMPLDVSYAELRETFALTVAMTIFSSLGMHTGLSSLVNLRLHLQ